MCALCLKGRLLAAAPQPMGRRHAPAQGSLGRSPSARERGCLSSTALAQEAVELPKIWDWTRLRSISGIGSWAVARVCCATTGCAGICWFGCDVMTIVGTAYGTQELNRHVDGLESQHSGMHACIGPSLAPTSAATCNPVSVRL